MSGRTAAAGRDIVGLQTLKDWNKAFHAAFRPRVDLIDHFVLGDRGLVVVNLHWKHDGGPFNGFAPTGKSGTLVESFQLRLEADRTSPDRAAVRIWNIRAPRPVAGAFALRSA